MVDLGGMMRVVTGVWRARWNVARWVVCAVLLWMMLADAGARAARLALSRLPDYDAAAEVARLRGEGRFGEALVLADAVLGREEVAASNDERAQRLRREREATVRARGSWTRRAKDVGWGALSGGAGVLPGAMSMEMLGGAVAADLLVFGDVRDLTIQGWRYATGGETDAVIAALSAVGLVTTLAPEVDWAPSILKAARRTGSMGERLGEFVVKAVKGRRGGEIAKLMQDTAAIAGKSSAGNAMRLLRLADGPEDVARIARFVSREGKTGAAALHVTGESGARALRVADEMRAAGKVDEAAAIEGLVVKASAKGDAGAAWLAGGGYRAMLKVHPVVGVLKGVWKGTAAALVQRMLRAMDPYGWWVVPALMAWLAVETWLFWRGMGRGTKYGTGVRGVRENVRGEGRRAA